ncbi:FecR family protein [Thalassobellus suaedae]|uniref:FecR family protein n=1 Tax=Thalassobellus suaedae TaxID=3074124 RepID=A0ABY9XUK6_9FLAO|nr:FecR family protein [Flavobacteriaceae bacterium HL-DH14]
MEFKLILKKLNNSISPKEELVFKAWYQEKKEHRQFFNNVKANYNKNIEIVDIEEAWQKIVDRIDKTKPHKTYWKFAVASVIVGLLGTGYFLKDNILGDSIEKKSVIINENSILPGIDKAILTLEDGSQIALEKGASFQNNNVNSNGEQLVYSSKEKVSKEIVYNYLTIPRGGEFYIVLSDGTQVWLNSESQLKYPVSFKEGDTRKVELVYGEAYFDVSPSSKHQGTKFKVYNRSQEIEVIGTEFNVKAYKDETNIYTTLVEGKVLVKSPTQNQVLKPKQQANLNLQDKSMSVATVNVYNEVSWKEGVFSFKGKPLKEIMKIVSRWYDIDVVFENKELENITFKGVLGKNQELEEILMTIKTLSILEDFEINNKTIILK